MGIGGHGALEQPVEEQPAVVRAVPVEAEGELVEVIVELLVADRMLTGQAVKLRPEGEGSGYPTPKAEASYRSR